MNTRELEKVAKAARVLLMEQCEARLNFVLSHESDPIFAAEGAAIRQLKTAKRETLIEKAAYTWFNRFTAFRFMDVHGFNRPLVLSPAAEGGIQPQLLSDALEGITPKELPAAEKKRVMDLLLGRIPSPNAQAEVYRLLFLNECKTLGRTLPFLFEEIDDPIRLLLPDDLLSEHSVPALLRSVMDLSSCKDVEIIGWLFQFYISDKKDAVMAKGGAVSSEDLPARTQLFTPEWIVRYLVENSLGRLWMENHPDSTLTQHMRYYVGTRNMEQGASENNIAKPQPLTPPPLDVEDIKILDPAAGSGHILVYAFELLTHIYEEEGYAKSQIPEMILRNNLYGLEIDPRAGQLAAFALVMKACLYDRSFYQRLRASQWNMGSGQWSVTGGQSATDDDNFRPNIGILQNIQFTTNEQQNYQKRLGKSLITQDLWLLMKQFENAETLGSLIVPKTAPLRDIEAVINASGLWDDLLLHETNKKLKDLLTLARMLSPRYDVVVANPPYLGNAFLSPEIKAYAETNYPNSKSDLFAMFIERGLDLIKPNGYSAMVTMQSWMFLSSYEKLRQNLPSKAYIACMAHMDNMVMGIAFGTSATIFKKQINPKYQGQYCYVRMSDIENGVPKEFPVRNERLRSASLENFRKIPGSPIAYWISKSAREKFEQFAKLGTTNKLLAGSSTGDNNKYQRIWHEIPYVNISFNAPRDLTKRWYPCNTGGEFRKYTLNDDYVIDWENDGYRIKHQINSKGKVGSAIRNREYFFKGGITWNKLSSSNFGVRIVPDGYISDDTARMITCDPEKRLLLLGFLCSNVCKYYLTILSPTMSFTNSELERLPVDFLDKGNEIENLVKINLSKSHTDRSSFETNWDFAEHPLFKSEIRNQKSEIRLEDCWLAWQWECEERFQTLKSNEEELNRIFIEIYGLQDELTPEVLDKDVTVRRADLARECRSLVSYAIGCIFGRYSLDKPGLQFAGGPDDGRKVPAVLPLSEEAYSKDDAAELVQQFLKEAYGEKYYAENLRFLEAGLGKDLRSYLCNDFYADHLKIYQKRPIYWLFQSPKGSFKALIYLHRYVPGRAADVLALCRELEARLELSSQQPAISGQLSKAEQRKAEKEAEKARTAFTEIKTWEKEVLAPLAEQRLSLDLDDGVKVNYAKFGTALAKIK